MISDILDLARGGQRVGAVPPTTPPARADCKPTPDAGDARAPLLHGGAHLVPPALSVGPAAGGRGNVAAAVHESWPVGHAQPAAESCRMRRRMTSGAET